MKSDYWSGVGKRLFSLGKTALNVAAPIAVDIGVNELVSRTCDSIELSLRKMYKKTLRNAIITFCLNLVGILLLAFRPFGQMPSFLIAVIFFLGAIVFFIVRLVLGIRDYGSTVFSACKYVLKEKSLHKGIESYVLNKFPIVALAYAGIDLGSLYLPALRDVPRIPSLIDFLVKHFWKRILLFLGIMALYTISVYWILKPILIQKFL
ncbi:MAG: hypothetical protein K5829_07640 [Treponema sp.]|nr:hypothetical protein [Treponema sp.]